MESSSLNLRVFASAVVLAISSFCVFADDEPLNLLPLSNESERNEIAKSEQDENLEKKSKNATGKKSIRAKVEKRTDFELMMWDYTPFWRRGKRGLVVRSSRVSYEKPQVVIPSTPPPPTSEDGSLDSVDAEDPTEEDSNDSLLTESVSIESSTNAVVKSKRFASASISFSAISSNRNSGLVYAISDKKTSEYFLSGNEYIGKSGLGKLNSSKDYFYIGGNGYTITGTEGQNLALINNFAIVNVDDSTWTGFDDNAGGSVLGGVFQNRGELNIWNSTFIDNNQVASSKGQNSVFGGVIANIGDGIDSGRLNIVDSSFINNSADRFYSNDEAFGGAIYNNGGAVTIFAYQKDVVFSENKDGFGGNDIFNNGSVQIDAYAGREVSFDGGINSFSWTKNDLKVNTTGTEGTIVFKKGSYVANQNISVGAGTLRIEDENSFAKPIAINIWNPLQYGAYTNSIEMTGGVIDIANDVAGTLYFDSVNGIGGNAKIDVDLANGVSDKIIGDNVIKQIEFTLEDINFIGGSVETKGEITLDLGNGLALAPGSDDVLERDGIIFDVSSEGNSVTFSRWLTINDVVEDANELVWTASGNVAKDKVYRDLGQMAGTELTLNGGEFTISGRKNPNKQYAGIIVSDGQNFTVNGGTWQEFSSEFGGFLYNKAGTSELNSIVIKGNTAQMGGAVYNSSAAYTTVNGDEFIGNTAIGDGLGGAIFNDGELTIVDTSFTNNYAANAGGAIYNNSNSVLNLIARDKDIIFSGNSMATGENNDIVNLGSTINMTVDADRTIVFGGGIQNSAGTININAVDALNARANQGKVLFKSGSINTNNLINLYAGTLTIEDGAKWVGGMIYVSEGAIVNSSGKINLQYAVDTAVENSGLITLTGGASELRQDGGFKNNINGTLVVTDGAVWVSTGLVENYSKDTIHITGTTTGGANNGASEWNQKGEFINGDGTNSGSVIIDGGSSWYSDPATTLATVQNNLNSKIVIGSLDSANGNGTWSSTGTVTNVGERIQVFGGSTWESSGDVTTSGSGKILIENRANWTINSGNVVFENKYVAAFFNSGTTTFKGGTLTTNCIGGSGNKLEEVNKGTLVFNNAGTADAPSWISNGNFNNVGNLQVNKGVYIKNSAPFFENRGDFIFTSATFADADGKNDTLWTNYKNATFNNSQILLNGGYTNGDVKNGGNGFAELKLENKTNLYANAFWNLDKAIVDNSNIYAIGSHSSFLNNSVLELKNNSVLKTEDNYYSANSKTMSLVTGSSWEIVNSAIIARTEDSSFSVNDKFVAAAKAATDSVTLSRGAVISAKGGIASISGGNITYGNNTGATIVAGFTDGNRDSALINISGSATVTLSSDVSLVLTGTSPAVEAAMAEGMTKAQAFVKVMNLVAGKTADWTWADDNAKKLFEEKWKNETASTGTEMVGEFEKVWINGIAYNGLLGEDGYVYIVIPEPSLFGLFSGILAIALLVSRRRRRK